MKRILIFLVVLVIAGGLYGIYLYNKKPADTHDENPDFELSATDLVKEFSANEEMATKKYVDKILIVTGPIKEVNTTASTVFLDGADPLITITCSFYVNEEDQLKKLKPGEVVHIKGKCTGKLIDIVMNNCILTNSK
jgi:hypothetical protein